MKQKMTRLAFVILALFSFSAAVTEPFALAEEQSAPEVFFGARVERILVSRCLGCHGSDAKGGLDLRSKESAFRGGDSGPVLVPGDAKKSRLFEYVSQGNMPPTEALPAEEVEVLGKWIDQGGYFPPKALDLFSFTTAKRAGYDWWSLQELAVQAVPDYVNANGERHPVDAFLRAKLRENSLDFSPPASRSEWIRRVYFDLTGLPPSFEEIQAFEQDTASDAFERVVDRLLASPHYGEQWGRHWLDVVRFAESNGFERDKLRENAWRYRDYVIDAFNADLPFDRFVLEQLAGDALRAGDPQGLTATGFLAMGPKNDVGTISELEKLITRQDELDDYVSVTMSTFLGLTVGCARCHDHKFDPVTSRDYYALTAVFSGLDRGDVVVATQETQSRHAEEISRLEAEQKSLKSRAETLLAPHREKILAERTAKPGHDEPSTDLLPMVSAARNQDDFSPSRARFVRFVIDETSNKSEPCLDELEVYGPDLETNLALAGLGVKATASSLLPGFPIHQVEHINDGVHGNSKSWISNEPGKGWVTLELPAEVELRRVIWGRDREQVFTDRVPTNYRIEVSTNGTDWTVVSSSQLRHPFRAGGVDANAIPLNEVLERLSQEEKTQYDRLVADLQLIDQQRKDLAPLPTAYAVTDAETKEAFLLHRGNVRQRREVVPPASVVAVDRVMNSTPFNPAEAGPQRRLHLAQWIASPRNPLTARVIVNRIWQHHFGRGIVSTPSDFGFNGSRPTHAELLDWLANDFIANGWRIKRLHRMIVLSQAYRQSTQRSQAGEARDHENTLLWRMNSRRLTAEELRDSILFTSGQLQQTLGGPSFRLFEYRDGNVPDYILLQEFPQETWRRTVYMCNIRTFREPLLTTFDAPDPCVQTARRDQTTTPLQALSLLNNPFIQEQSQKLSDKLSAAADQSAKVEELVASAYRVVLGRQPSPAEQRRAAEFASRYSLAQLCRVLFNSSEFVFVR